VEVETIAEPAEEVFKIYEEGLKYHFKKSNKIINSKFKTNSILEQEQNLENILNKVRNQMAQKMGSHLKNKIKLNNIKTEPTTNQTQDLMNIENSENNDQNNVRNRIDTEILKDNITEFIADVKGSQNNTAYVLNINCDSAN